MVRQRVYGILADYEDQNDHDTLRSDPVFKLIADGLPDGPDLASQPTRSRFENAVSIPDLWRMRDMLVDLFIQSFDMPPRHLILDIDAFDDPAHGQRQLVLFHGYYEQYQYLPIVITCAEKDLVLPVGLRHGTCHASLGADDDLRYLMGRLRAVWPDMRIHVRRDSGLGVPLMYDVCQQLGLTYTFGIGMNSRLRAISDDLLKEALEEYERTCQPRRPFRLVDYQAESWPAPQPVVIKAEAHAKVSRFAITELYVALHVRSTENRPSLVRPSVEAGRVGTLSPGLRSADCSSDRPDRDTWTSQGSSGVAPFDTSRSTRRMDIHPSGRTT